MKVMVSYATTSRQIEITITVEPDCTVESAIRQSELLSEFPEIDLSTFSVGIYGKKTTLDHRIQEGDRIEVYRPLLIDPKQARRLRAKKS